MRPSSIIRLPVTIACLCGLVVIGILLTPMERAHHIAEGDGG